MRSSCSCSASIGRHVVTEEEVFARPQLSQTWSRELGPGTKHHAHHLTELRVPALTTFGSCVGKAELGAPHVDTFGKLTTPWTLRNRNIDAILA